MGIGMKDASTIINKIAKNLKVFFVFNSNCHH